MDVYSVFRAVYSAVVCCGTSTVYLGTKYIAGRIMIDG